MPGMSSSNALSSVASEHVPALIAALLTPLAVWLVVVAIRALARGGSPTAGALARCIDAFSWPTGAVLVLLLVTGIDHLALVPAHWPDERTTAVLFLLNGLAFLGVAAWTFLQWPRWRLAAAALLAATVLAYVVYIATGREDPDLLGLLTKAVEIAALGIVIATAAPSAALRRSRRPVMLVAAALVVLGLSGAVARAAFQPVSDGGGMQPGMQEMDPAPSATPMPAMPSMSKADGGDQGCAAGAMPMGNSAEDFGMMMEAVPDRAPTAQEQQDAAQFAQQTAAGIAQYADPQAALAAGYKPLGGSRQFMTHWVNVGFMRDGDPLDPTRPASLMFENTASGPQLIGAMYIMPYGQCGPDFGGPITDWHEHTNLCYSSPTGGWLESEMTPQQPQCPAGSYNHDSQWMLHVWTVPVAGGPYTQADQVRAALLAGR